MSDRVCKQTLDCFHHAFHHVTAVGCDVLLALELAFHFAYTLRKAGSLQRNGHVSLSTHARNALLFLDHVDTSHTFGPLAWHALYKSVRVLTQDNQAVNMVALVFSA